MNTKIKDQTLVNHLSAITQIVTDAVMNVFQSFVETLKRNGTFDEAAQKEAKEKAMAIVESQLTGELRKYIADNYGDVQE